MLFIIIIKYCIANQDTSVLTFSINVNNIFKNIREFDLKGIIYFFLLNHTALK